jgi:hypothetical protein
MVRQARLYRAKYGRLRTKLIFENFKKFLENFVLVHVDQL